MKFTVILATVLAATTNAANNVENTYASRLLRSAKATPDSQLIRKLEGDDAYEVDLSGYSVKFQKCQFVKSYDDDLAADEDAESVLATRRFVVFRLCPDSCSSCSYNYGEYLVDLETYLQASIDYQKDVQQEMCNTCQNYCGSDDDANAADDDANAAADDDDANAAGNERNLGYYGVDCDTCYDECMKIENMQDNGYVDAAEFIECQMIYDPEDDDKATLYAGPMCASSGSKIKIGVFTDENCYTVDTSKDVDDFLYNEKLSHALLKTVYSQSTCVSCSADDDASDMCQTLYQDAAKCETTHGFSSGYASYDDYDNQVSNEEIVCDFITSIKTGSYDDDGEIIVTGSNTSPGSKTTTGQKFALTFFVSGTAGLAFYAATLHRKLTKGGFSHNLVSQGGDLA